MGEEVNKETALVIHFCEMFKFSGVPLRWGWFYARKTFAIKRSSFVAFKVDYAVCSSYITEGGGEGEKKRTWNYCVNTFWQILTRRQEAIYMFMFREEEERERDAEIYLQVVDRFPVFNLTSITSKPWILAKTLEILLLCYKCNNIYCWMFKIL